MQKLHLKLFYFQQELFQLLLLHQHSHHILLIYLPTFFYTYNLYNLNTHQHHMIYHIHTCNYQNSKYILYYIHLYQLIFYIHTCIYHNSNVIYYYKYLHLIYIYTYMFHAISCLVSLVLDIRLNTLTFLRLLQNQEYIFLDHYYYYNCH